MHSLCSVIDLAYRESGSLGSPVTGKKRGRKFAFSEQDLRRLRNLVAEKPDWTPKELGEELGFDVKPLTVWRAPMCQWGGSV